MPLQAIQFKTWKDKGGNIGITCLNCGRTHWTGQESTLDPTTGKECENCIAIKSSGLLEEENRKHKEESENSVCEHPTSQP